MHDCLFSGCSSHNIANASSEWSGLYATGGAIRLDSWASSIDLYLHSCIIRDCTASGVGVGVKYAAGGAVAIYNGMATLEGCVVSDCAASYQGWQAMGGAFSVLTTTALLSLSCCSIKGCTVTNSVYYSQATNRGSITPDGIPVYYSKGGGVYVARGHAVLMSCTVVDCTAASFGSSTALSYAAGGLLYVGAGTILLGNSTFLRNGTVLANATADARGIAMYAESGSITYILPAPLGRWVAASLCSITYQACPSEEASCDRTELGYEGVLQQCAWDTSAELIDQYVHSVPAGGVEYDEYPFACPLGVYGGDQAAASQSGPLCTGSCLPGHACSSVGTAVPRACPAGTCTTNGILTYLLPTTYYLPLTTYYLLLTTYYLLLTTYYFGGMYHQWDSNLSR